MREITTHKVNGCNDGLQIVASDKPGSGGANHVYEVSGFSAGLAAYDGQSVTICFQNGPIKQSGINGVTHEVLLAIVADRLECFQRGPFACQENQEALGHVKAAMAILKSRTEKRMARGVEGTHEK